ncbi:methyl-accepting chemotaxis protein [Lysinibacillus piscis]|uniref:Chemotaxis protein n=1 Tax=Lysinibacillus piscis TaxID=2518931 RepID=A0ABQ5NR32_9BACI|nr:methyl-accepting chemotaxis protein [Lysinibacillus sp. KH24]GLC90576.1 chemotaxis protein [Lysinibacillus sp. KH24]
MEIARNDVQVTDDLVVQAIERNVAVIRFDVNHRVAYVNELFAKTMGYTVEEMVGMTHDQLCLPEYANSSEYKKFWNNLIAGQSYQGKVERVNAQGNRIWLEATYMPVFATDSKKVVGVSKIATDITDRQIEILSVADVLKLMSQELYNRSEAGIQNSEGLRETIQGVAKESEDNVQNLSQLQQQAESIKGIVKTIQEIAAQTNLLALNAAIEAARAGEYGRGFDVVAKEVRKLSEKVEQSIAEVKNNVEGIEREINQVTNSITRIASEVQKTHEQISITARDFNEIATAAEALDVQSKQFIAII